MNSPLITPKLPPTNSGEGFKGERFITIVGIGLTIISTILLIELTLIQRKVFKAEILKRKNKTS